MRASGRVVRQTPKAKHWDVIPRFAFGAVGYREGLETNPIVLGAGIVDRDKPNFLATNADVGHVDAQHFQAAFELFQGEIVLVYHDSVSFCVSDTN